MRLINLAVIAIVAVLALAAQTSAATSANTLIGTVGPGFTITMNQKTVKAGTYKIIVRDRSDIHDFHLTGPGVNKKTSVSSLGTTTWTVTLKKGTYRFVCDHARGAEGHVRRRGISEPYSPSDAIVGSGSG